MREAREPTEVCVHTVSRYADDRDVQMTSDDAGDLAERYALFGDCMIHGVLRSAL